jgi:Tfp pilus assembly protein FimT
MTGRRERVILYGVIAALVAILMVIGVASWRTERATRAAEEKADRLIAAFEELGTRVPSRDQIVKVLGEDGGSVCADPTNALRRAAYLAQLSNGAGGPGTRPVIANSRVAKGELAIITIYCPDKLSDFKEFVDDLHTTDPAPE